jgi:uncharacterized protein (DUF2336 family)
VRSDFPIQTAGEASLSKSDRLFRSAVTAYCSLTRPTGRDAAQLDDLALPLLPLVNEESKRFAAAALSEVFPAPPTLLRRLADCPVAISAPLLLRSRALADIDLIGLIGRNGIGHARAIARRSSLNGNIAALINALGIAPLGDTPAATAPAEAITAPKAGERKPAGVAAEETREQLRGMMEPAQPAARAVRPDAPIDWVAAHAAYARMVATGMTGVAALFHTAVADAFDMGFDGARRMIEDEEGTGLATALKAAGLSAAEAFLVAALAFPPRIGSTAAIRDFVERYRALDVDDARRQVSAWRDKAPRSVVVQDEPEAANSDDDRPEAARKALKAS